MEPSPEPPPPNLNPRELTPISSDLPPDTPSRRVTLRPTFPDPDPITAVPADYFPKKEQFDSFTGQLREGLQLLVQGLLDYRLTSLLDSWNGADLCIQQREFDTAARLVAAVLDAGPHVTNKNSTPLGVENWGTLASACLAAIARGFTRPLMEATHKEYITYWESLDDNPQRKLDEGENPEFHSLLQWLKATTQHLGIHINTDEADGMCKWTTMAQKEIEEAARRSASADIERVLHDWKINQLTIRQQRLEDALKKTILECNMDLFQSSANELRLTIGDSATIPPL